MIANDIAYWRSTMNGGKGVSQAHLARKVRVTRSFVTKLEKGKGQPGAELMFRVARYFKQPVEAVFRLADGTENQSTTVCIKTIPDRRFADLVPAPAKPLGNSPATPLARPAAQPECKKIFLTRLRPSQAK